MSISKKMKMNLDLEDLVLDENTDYGYCVACSQRHDNINADARRLECDNCGEKTVFGINKIRELAE